MLRFRPVIVEDKNAGTIRAGNLFARDPQVNPGVAQCAKPAIARDRPGFNMDDLGMIDRIRLYAHKGGLRYQHVTMNLLALFRSLPKLAVMLILMGCATTTPFPAPRASPGHLIITSGVFNLPDGAHLPYRLYPAQGKVKTVVLALHGYTDSRDGWQLLAQSLTPHGISIYAPDLSSFGATKNRGVWPGTDVLVNEAQDEARLLRAHYPHTPLYIMGESMGGAIGILLGASPHPPPVNGYILSAPAVWGGSALSPVYKMTLRIADFWAPNARLTGQSAHVLASDNIPALIAFGEDPLTLQAPRISNIAGLVRLMGQAQQACAHFTQPALMLYGGQDELIPKSAMRACWQAIPLQAPVILAYYPPDYHLLLRDLERAVPDADILAFLQGRGLPSGASSQATIFLATGP